MALEFDTVPFRLRLRQPLKTARGPIAVREGWLLRIRDANGFTGWGEACPLEGFATVQAATAHAYDQAFLDLQAQRAGISVARLLGGRDAATSIEVNALETPMPGVSSLKLKVGSDWEADLARVRAVRDQHPKLSLRLDANAGWTREAARAAVEALAELDIELLEQPLAAEDLEGLAELRRHTRIPIAVDESITDLESARRILEAGAAEVFVLKPMRLGGLLAAASIAALARESDIAVVVTTTLDAAIGRTGALHLAAAFGSEEWAHGLATGSLLEEDVAQGPEPRDGRMFLPSGPGLGVSP